MAKKKGKKRARLRLEDLHLEPWQRAEIEKQLGRAIGAAAGEQDVRGLEVAVDEGVTDRDLKPQNAPVADRDLKPANVTKPRMNLTEAAYAKVLEARKAAGTVLWFEFEWASLRLAKATHYRPDFAVLVVDRSELEHGGPARLEFHEVKGYWRDDARAKIKIAADKFPFHFLAVQKKPKREGGGWVFEHFPGAEAGTRG